MKSKLLTDLKKALAAEAPVAPKPKAPPPPRPRDDDHLSDEELFARASAGARRITTEAPPPPAAPRRKPDAQVALRRAQAEGPPESSVEGLSDTAALLNPVAAEATLSFFRAGVQQKQFKKLKQGLIPWQAAVDLHGCTLDEAREAVEALVSQARRDGNQVVKIVHGKGVTSAQPLLKTCVNGWLQQLSSVLAFVSAQPRDGGTGAVYVLLKKRPLNESGDDSADLE